jgi:hypothetical protein
MLCPIHALQFDVDAMLMKTKLAEYVANSGVSKVHFLDAARHSMACVLNDFFLSSSSGRAPGPGRVMARLRARHTDGDDLLALVLAASASAGFDDRAGKVVP